MADSCFAEAWFHAVHLSPASEPASPQPLIRAQLALSKAERRRFLVRVKVPGAFAITARRTEKPSRRVIAHRTGGYLRNVYYHQLALRYQSGLDVCKLVAHQLVAIFDIETPPNVTVARPGPVSVP